VFIVRVCVSARRSNAGARVLDTVPLPQARGLQEKLQVDARNSRYDMPFDTHKMTRLTCGAVIQ
jgi:hypothetical protein